MGKNKEELLMEKKKDYLEVIRLLEEVLQYIRDGFPEDGALDKEQTDVWDQLKILVGEVNQNYFESKAITFNSLSDYLAGDYDGKNKKEIGILYFLFLMHF